MSSLTPIAPRPPSSGQTNGSTRDQITVLVIEDDAQLLQLIRRYLEGEGYLVVTAADGEEGLRLVAEHPGGVNLVLTDIEMPNIDGITVAMVLSALRPQLGVICMSGGMGRTVFQESIGLLPRPFLTKPFTFEELAKETAETLARAREQLDRNNDLLTRTRDFLASGNPVTSVDLVAAAKRLRAQAAVGGGTLPTIQSAERPHDTVAQGVGESEAGITR